MSKAFAKSLSQLNRALIRRLNALVIRAQPPPPGRPDGRVAAAAALDALPVAAGGGAAVCKVEGGLLRSSSAFPYFMLVALEAGGLLRGLLLLVLYPALRLLGHGGAIKAMVVVSFLGLRKDAFRAGRAALPRLLLEDLSAEVFDATVEVSTMPQDQPQPPPQVLPPPPPPCSQWASPDHRCYWKLVTPNTTVAMAFGPLAAQRCGSEARMPARSASQWRETQGQAQRAKASQTRRRRSRGRMKMTLRLVPHARGRRKGAHGEEGIIIFRT